MRLLLAIILLQGVFASPTATPLVSHLSSSTSMQVPLFSAENAQLIDDQYMVVLKKGLDPQDIEEHHNVLAEMIQSDRQSQLLHVYEMQGLDGYAGKFSADTIESIRKLPQVDFVEQDQVVYALDTQKNAPWGLARISHREALTFRTYNRYPHDPNGGKNVTVYVIDTGINVNHVDFGGRAVWGATIPSNDQDIDGNGHGTHCAGTIAGSRYGVAKQARVVAVKVLRSNGSGTMSDVVRGVEWALSDHKQRSKAKTAKSAANMSLGGGFSRALNMAVDAAVEGGVHFAVAAGNDDADACDYSPASSELAITVGASTLEDERAYFSNKGKCVDVFGPGKDITSTWIGSNTATNTISGTSMASPHVAGLLAYMLSAWKGDAAPSTKELKDKLLSAATKDKLNKVPTDTPNLLIWNDPPADNLTPQQDAGLVEAAMLMEMMQQMFGDQFEIVVE
jgi:cerevisin